MPRYAEHVEHILNVGRDCVVDGTDPQHAANQPVVPISREPGYGKQVARRQACRPDLSHMPDPVTRDLVLLDQNRSRSCKLGRSSPGLRQGAQKQFTKSI